MLKPGPDALQLTSNLALPHKTKSKPEARTYPSHVYIFSHVWPCWSAQPGPVQPFETAQLSMCLWEIESKARRGYALCVSQTLLHYLTDRRVRSGTKLWYRLILCKSILGTTIGIQYSSPVLSQMWASLEKAHMASGTDDPKIVHQRRFHVSVTLIFIFPSPEDDILSAFWKTHYSQCRVTWSI